MATQLQERPLRKVRPIPALGLADICDHVDDRPCPLFFIVAPAFVGAFLWLWAILSTLRP